MSWRVVVISSRAKLDLKLNYLVVRGYETRQIYLGEISTLIIESTGVSLTAALLSELVKRKIKVIFCDERRSPQSELLPYYGSHDTSSKVKLQIGWDNYTKDTVWTEIVREKIKKQRDLLREIGTGEWELLDKYVGEIKHRDASNREGHAAKVYFNALFGMSFTRAVENEINAALNYGYSIILSAVNREVCVNGYITQIGLFHDNIFNQFNLSSDFMEPFRPLVDRIVYNMKPKSFGKEEKLQLVNVLNEEVYIAGKRNYVNNAIKLYCRSLFDALNERDIAQISFYERDEL